ncbi:hypothetical protein JCM6882_003768 [Rhodosporidiobolus microsporus]
MRASTFSLVSLLALVASVAAAPVAAPVNAEVAVPVVDESSTVFEAAVEELEADDADLSEVHHTLDKRAQTCKKVSQCKNKLTVKNSVRVCSSKKCTWACKSGYTKKGNTCNKKASSSKSSSSKSSSSAVNLASTAYSGKGTYFYQNGNPGACGNYNSDSTYLVALQSSMYAGGKHCGKNVRITANGKTITAKVQDECPTCVTTQSLDMSEGAFKALSPLSAGLIDIKWSFV